MFIQDVDIALKDWDFSQRKNLPYEIKLNLTETRIITFHRQFSPYVSFSGGLDSTVLLHQVRKYLGTDVPAVFCDTGLEFPEIKEFVARANKIYGNVITIHPEKSFVSVLSEYGYPFPSKEVAQGIRKLRHGNLCERYRNYLLNGDERGKIGMIPKKWQYLKSAPVDVSEKCCDVMKKQPFAKYERETGYKPFIGITQDESFRRARQYARTGCNITEGKHIQSKPLGFWTKQDILRYVYENNIDYCSVYGRIDKASNGVFYNTGEARTGCMFCLFGISMENNPNRIQRLAETHPDIYDYIMRGGRFDENGLLKPEKGLGYRKLQDTFGIDLEPFNQTSLFDERSSSNG